MASKAQRKESPVDSGQTTWLVVDRIRTDGGTQARATIDPATVDDYADVYARLAEAGRPRTDVAAVVVYYDGKYYWLADGFHRVNGLAKFLSANNSQRFDRTIHADIRQGTQRDAVLFACGANATHGLRRTPGDKRRAVETLLRDPEWAKWSDREVASRCQVSHPFVAEIRRSVSVATGNVSSEGGLRIADCGLRNVKTKDGRTMNVAAIGKANAQRADPPMTAYDAARKLSGPVIDKIRESKQATKPFAKDEALERRIAAFIEHWDFRETGAAAYKTTLQLVDLIGFRPAVNPVARAEAVLNNPLSFTAGLIYHRVRNEAVGYLTEEHVDAEARWQLATAIANAVGIDTDKIPRFDLAKPASSKERAEIRKAGKAMLAGGKTGKVNPTRNNRTTKSKNSKRRVSQ